MKAAQRTAIWLAFVLASAAAIPSIAVAQPEAVAPASVHKGGEPPAEQRINMCYFHNERCSRCRHYKHQLDDFIAANPQVQLDVFEWHERDTFRIFRATLMQLGVDEDTIAKVQPPVLVVGHQWVFLHDDLDETLPPLLASAGGAVAERVWDVDETALQMAEASIRRYFSSYGPLGVIALGLVDGINPCAIATLVFFVSYLAFLGRQGRDVLLAGLAFAAGIWIMYFAIGLGLAQIILSIKNIDVLRTAVNVIMLVISGVFAVVSFQDFRKLREGRTDAVTLQLPTALKRRIHAAIRERTRTSLIAVGAFTAGLIVSCIELACTGQVYLPAVAFLTDVPSLKRRVIMWLAVYNFAFVLPLLGITGAAYFGAKSSSLANVAQRNAAVTKLVMALFFAAIALYFAYTLSAGAPDMSGGHGHSLH